MSRRTDIDVENRTLPSASITPVPMSGDTWARVASTNTGRPKATVSNEITGVVRSPLVTAPVGATPSTTSPVSWSPEIVVGVVKA